MNSLSYQRARLVDDMNGEDFVIHAAIRGPDSEAAGQMLKEKHRRSTCPLYNSSLKKQELNHTET